MSDSFYVNNNLVEANKLFDKDSFAKSFNQAEVVYNLLKQDTSFLNQLLAESAYLMGRSIYRLGNLSKAKILLIEAMDIWEKLAPDYQLKKAKAKYYLSFVEFRSNNIELALIYSRSSLQLQIANLENPVELIKTYILLGFLLTETGLNKEASFYYDQAYELTNPLYKISNLTCGSLLRDMARNLANLNEYSKSIGIFEKAITYFFKEQNQENAIAECLIRIGESYHRLNKYTTAINYFEKALVYSKQSKLPRKILMAWSYSRIGDCHFSLSNSDKAFENYHKVIENMGDMINQPVYRYVYINLGKAYLENKEHLLAQDWFNQALLKIGKPSSPNDSSDLALTHKYIAKNKFLLGELDSAEYSLKLSINILEALFTSSYEEIAEVYFDLGSLYLAKLKFQDSNRYDSLSNYYFKKAVNLIVSSLTNKRDPISIRKSLMDAIPFIEEYIQLLLRDKNSGSDFRKNFEEAWYLSEIMHNYLLYSERNNAKALYFSEIPDSLLTKDSLFKKEIIELEKERRKLMEINSLSITDSTVLIYNSKIFEQKMEHQNFVTSLEKKYPDYFYKKFSTKTASVEEVQQNLDSNQTLLEFYCGDSTIFVFILSSSRYFIKEIKLDFPLKVWIKNLNDGITGYFTTGNKSTELYRVKIKNYIESASQLYDRLIQPFNKYLSSKLIIIPDAVLGNLSFESLLSFTPSDPTNFKTYPFLIKQHSIQYAYSATTWLQSKYQQYTVETKNQLLAFAPFAKKLEITSNNRILNDSSVKYDLSSLPSSGEEMVRIKKHFPNNSIVLTNAEATVTKFFELAPKFRIIHLATHSKANFDDGNFSYVAFNSQSDEEEQYILSVADVYNMRLNNDLVVLSACETAQGEVHQGEGVISIASAFTQAGAKSIIASLWKVNDRSTMEIMDLFYKQLKQGKSKNLALSDAKKIYMNLNPGLASHPYYWSGFICIGDTNSLK